MTILIADDEPVSRRLLQATLVRLGHEVTAVGDGLQARTLLLQPDGPRLAILDWMMPGLDGLAVCRSVRTQAEHYVYIILLTAHSRREDVVAGLGAEADDFLSKPFDAVELAARLRSGERILDLQARLLRTQEALRHEATHDRLTGLWNRGTVLDRLSREHPGGTSPKAAFGVGIVDIDHFKAINDRYGHAAGDGVLHEAAVRMQRALRPTDAIGRYGGEEFLLILPDCPAQAAWAIGDRIRKAVCESPIVAGDSRIHVTASIGMACWPTTAGSAASLINAADLALYQAKTEGRNRVRVAGSSGRTDQARPGPPDFVRETPCSPVAS